MCHVECSVEIIFFSYLVKSGSRHHLVLVAQEVHIDLMPVIRQRQVNGTEHQFSYPAAFINKIVYIRIEHHQERAVGRCILHIRTQDSLHGRYLRKCFRNHIEVDLAQFEMQFLHLLLFRSRMYPQRHIFLARQPEIGCNIFLILIEYIIVRIQFERAESQDRIIGEQMEIDPFFHFVRPQSEQDTGISGPIRVQKLCIGKRTSYLSLHAGSERCLFTVYCFNHIGTIQQSERVLAHSETDRIEPGSITHQIVDTRIHAETFFRRRESFQIQVIERYISLLQDIINRVVFPRRYSQMHIGKQRTESRDIDHRVFLQLLVQAFRYLGELIGHRFEIGISCQCDSQVAGMERDTGRIFRTLSMQGQSLGFIFSGSRNQFPVTQRDVDQVVFSHIGFRFRK